MVFKKLNKGYIRKLKPLILLASVFVLCYSVAFYISAAWSDAPNSPTGCPSGYPGCDAPLNAGPTAQYKIGSLGIGITPTAKFEVAAPILGNTMNISRIAGQASIKSTDPNGYLIMDSNGQAVALNWYSANNVILVNGGGNVGIGTATPGVYKLNVNGLANATQLCIAGDCKTSWAQAVTELDPIFSASVAKNITGTNVSNWNSAFAWGSHAIVCPSGQAVTTIAVGGPTVCSAIAGSGMETDPVWNSQKGAYATQSWVNSALAPYATQSWVTGLGYTTQAWVIGQGYATQSWVNSQGFLRTESDPIWNSQKSAYATQSWVTGLGYTTQAWVQSQGYTTLPAVQSWVTSQGYINPSWFAGNTINKLNVNTIDPIYEIEGKKYATYVADFSGGVRMETAEVLSIPQSKEVLINFNDLEKGSNLWLFWQASNKNINDLVVILTSSFNGKVWYEKQSNSIKIFTDQPGEVSYRLTIPRNDAKDWPNLLEYK